MEFLGHFGKLPATEKPAKSEKKRVKKRVNSDTLKGLWMQKLVSWTGSMAKKNRYKLLCFCW